MLFQNVEFFETEKFQYVLIHKNGSSSVRKSIDYLNPFHTTQINLSKIRWTVIRDPYERFVSGLKYDLKKQNLNIEDVEISSLFNCKINLFSRVNGNVNHTSSQILYLINTNINWYVQLKDLNIFQKVHFNNISYENKNEKNIKIDLDKKEIMKYLELDYYIYNNILNSNNLWKWQNGKIF